MRSVQPLTALTLMQSPGPESWHPNPAFLFQEGAGPLWDIGPYYLTTLVQLFGPVAAVAGLGSKSREKRTIGSGPLAGTDFDVTVPTHVSAIAQFESGQSSQSIFSFDSPLSRGGFVEITGSEATLAVPDPNGFDGEIKIRRRGADDWETIAETKAVGQRGTGVLEMARAIRADRPHRATGALAFHIVDVMASITESIDTGAFVDVTEHGRGRGDPAGRLGRHRGHPVTDDILLDPRRTVVFAGDSVTDCGRRTDPEGSATATCAICTTTSAERRPRIVNAGISGNRAVDLVGRWSTDVLAARPVAGVDPDRDQRHLAAVRRGRPDDGRVVRGVVPGDARSAHVSGRPDRAVPAAGEGRAGGRGGRTSTRSSTWSASWPSSTAPSWCRPMSS